MPPCMPHLFPYFPVVRHVPDVTNLPVGFIPAIVLKDVYCTSPCCGCGCSEDLGCDPADGAVAVGAVSVSDMPTKLFGL